MAILRDFVVNQGLVVNTTAIINGVDILANDYTTYTTLTGNIYNTYTTLDGRIDAVQGNIASLESGYAANDYNTYTTLVSAYAANDYSTYTTLQGEYAANDGVTLDSARANDYSTYTTLVNEYRANDYSTYNTLLAGYRANDHATWSGLNAYINEKANASVNVIAGDGTTGGGPLTSNITIAVDASVVRTSGAQNIGGTKTFTDNIVIAGDLTVEGNTTTIGTTSLLVEDKFIELGSNTTGTPVGDVGIYLNRGDQGNSAIYYDQSAGYFALADTLDPSTNTEVSPSSYAALRIGTLLVSNTALVTNLNADALDGQQGSYYLDFGNSTNTDVITLARVTANGASTTDAIIVGGLTVDSNTVHVDTTNNFVGIRTVVPHAPLQVEALGVATKTITTTTTTANQVLDSFAAGIFRTAKYLVQVHDTANNDYHACEILLIHDGTTAYITEYAIVYSDASLATFNADISGGNARLLVTPINTTNTIRVVRNALAV
jgi:hypothetical protein